MVVNVLEENSVDQHILFDLCATVSLDGNGGRSEEFGFPFTAFLICFLTIF